MSQHRAVLDFVIAFTNAGDFRGTGFRLDVPRADVTRDEVAALLVRHLGLHMVGTVELTSFAVVEEAHKGSRGFAADRSEAGAEGRRQLVDLNHAITKGMTTYPGLPGPEIEDHLARDAAERVYGPGVRFQIGRISMVANTGTYIDSPFHRFDGGTDLSGLPLERIADVPGVVVRVTGSTRRAVDVSELAAHDVTGRAVLVHTGWDRQWGTPAYGVDAPFLTGAAARWLVEQRAAVVGIDSINIDDMGDKTRPVHTALLGAGIPVVEHLTGLDRLPTSGFRFHAAPPRVADLGTFPVRAYAVVG